MPVDSFGGVPVYGTGGEEIGRTLTLDAMASLGGYLIGVRQWMQAAQTCLEAQR